MIGQPILRTFVTTVQNSRHSWYWNLIHFCCILYFHVSIRLSEGSSPLYSIIRSEHKTQLRRFNGCFSWLLQRLMFPDSPAVVILDLVFPMFAKPNSCLFDRFDKIRSVETWVVVVLQKAGRTLLFKCRRLYARSPCLQSTKLATAPTYMAV